MELRLSQQQADELRELLGSALSDLRSEIHHTDDAGFRERLHERERLLMGVQAELGEHAAAAPAP